MYKKFQLTCPRDHEKRYFSWEHQHYKNNLTVKLNNTVLFANINDCEENLPITFKIDIAWSNSGNIVEFDYDINMHEVKEFATIALKFSDQKVTLEVCRPLPVPGAEHYEFSARFRINDRELCLGKEYHQGHQKKIMQIFPFELDQPFMARWSCRKRPQSSTTVYHDDLIMELT
jgi:hypothetical protein